MRWQLLLSGLVILGGYVLLFYLKTGAAFWAQLKGQSGFIAHAVEPFLFSPGMWLGIFAGLILPGRSHLAGQAAKVTLLLLLIGLGTGHYIGQLSFGVMGLATGLWLRIDRNNVIVTALLATAWMTGISVGYNTPALGSGPLMAYILICCGVFFTRPKIQVVLWFLTWMVFSYARLYLPYREAPFHACRYPVGEVMKAGKGLYTNGYTFAVLKELDSLRQIYPTAVPLPDFCASWLQSGQVSPIPSLWPNKTETRSEVVRNQIDSVIREEEGRYTWLVQKYVTAELATGWVPMYKVTPYPVVESAEKYLSVKDSTTYFMIYQ